MFEFAQRDSGGGDFHGVSDRGGGGGAAVCAHGGAAGGRALHALLGIQRFPTDDTIRNLFKRFRQSLVVQFYEPLWAWQLARVPERAGGYSLDLDSTVFERYGEQEGVKRGYPMRFIATGPGNKRKMDHLRFQARIDPSVACRCLTSP